MAVGPTGRPLDAPGATRAGAATDAPQAASATDAAPVGSAIGAPAASAVDAAQTSPALAASPGALFRLAGVGYDYSAGVEALAAVDLAVDRGERLAILGANGSGKSTLLKLLAGLVEPTRGTVEAFGARIDGGALRDEATAQGFRRRVGMVFQSADAQLFNPTVRDEVAFGPLHLDLPHDEIVARVDDTLAMLGLGALADRAPYNLSGGEKKKVALASVLSINPEVLMLDEPTNGLDPRTQEWLIELLEQLHHAGKTIVVATHQLDLLERLVDRAVVLGEDHRPAADGPLADVLADRELLLSVNLIHEHAHHHGALLHSHAHAHPPGRERHGGDEAEHRHEHQAARHAEGHREHAHDTAAVHAHDTAAVHDHDHQADGAQGAPAEGGPAAESRREAPPVAPDGEQRPGGAPIARRAAPHDAAALAALATELGYPSEPTATAARLNGLLSSAADVVFVVAGERGGLLGFVHAAEKRLLVSAPFVELEGLIVSAAARRRGVAAALVAAVEAWSLERGVGELRVRARVERDVADRFYRGRGFALEKQQRVFVKRLEGAERV